MRKKLTRSSKDSIISGVCGGLGEYFDIDTEIVRICWVLLTTMNFITGIFTYIVCAIVIPEENEIIYDSNDSSKKNTPMFIGLILIVLGTIKLIDIIFPRFFTVFNIFKYWPVLLILAGIYIIVKQRGNK